MSRRVILLEFNELCPRLLDQWMSIGLLPNFRRFYQQSQVFITEADETEAPYLEPWIQWYSIHTGLSYREHGVFHLTDGPAVGHRDIWKILLAHSKLVANWSSMNTRGLSAPGSFFLPDPWCTSETPYPASLRALHDVIVDQVHEYTNPTHRLDLRRYLSFVRFLVRRGLRRRTILAIARQLGGELIARRGTWRRAVLMDKLLSDVFRHYYRRNQPDFATFFLNSTAHYQHAYWRHMEPDVFVHKPSADERAEYRDAILFGYQQMDELLADFFALEAEGATLVLATALSQQPYLKHEQTGGHRFYHPKDMQGLLRMLEVKCEEFYPVMAHQYVLRFASDELKDQARHTLETVTYEGHPVFGFANAPPKNLFMGNDIKTSVAPHAKILIGAGPARGEVLYHDLFHPIAETKSGYHHPDGALWFKTGRHRVHPGKVSVLDILPTLLSQLGVPWDTSDRPTPPLGKDLSPLFAK